MSTERPPNAESGPQTPDTLSPEALERVAERNTVPPTPEPPTEAIGEVLERLAQAETHTTQAQTTSAPAPAAQRSAPSAKPRGPFTRIAYGTGTVLKQGVKIGGGFLWGVFGYILLTTIHALKNLPSFGGGGGGGGSSKSSGGGGHH
jgi:uncharacterized membrane protein YgcG